MPNKDDENAQNSSGDTAKDGDVCEDYKKLLKQYISMENDVKSYMEAAEKIKPTATSGEKTEQEVFDQFDDFYDEFKKAKPPIEHHAAYKQFLKATSADGEAEDVDIGDEDLVIASQTQSYRCPFTGKEMVDPVKNTNCGHSYDREGIAIYIKQRGRHARCPVSGCMAQDALTTKCLVPDKKLKRELEKRQRKGQK